MAFQPDELMVLRRFARTPEGTQVVGMLQTMLGDTDRKLRTLTGEHLHQCQGRAQQLQELIELIQGAEQALQRQDSRARRPMAMLAPIQP